MAKSKKRKLLSNLKREDSNNDYDLILLEQYKLYAQKLEGHHNRHINIVKFFISIQLIFLSGFLFVIKDEIQIGNFGIIIMSLVAILFCLVWLATSLSHNRLSTAKHETLEEIESYLPIRPFSYEWDEKLKSGKKYYNIRGIFISIPILMSLIYISLGVIVLLN